MVALSERERKFVRALTGEACGNITKAALTAGCSEKSAARIGHRLSKRVHVQEAIQAIREKLDAKAMLTAEQVEQELDRVILSKPIAPPTHGERLKAIELKGKRLKMWHDASGGDSRITVNIGFLTKEQPALTASVEVIDALTDDANS